MQHISICEVGSCKVRYLLQNRFEVPALKCEALLQDLREFDEAALGVGSSACLRKVDLQCSFWMLKQRRMMTGPSLGRPQFFLQEVWEGGTPLKAGWRRKLFILHMTMKTVDTFGPLYQSQEQG